MAQNQQRDQARAKAQANLWVKPTRANVVLPWNWKSKPRSSTVTAYVPGEYSDTDGHMKSVELAATLKEVMEMTWRYIYPMVSLHGRTSPHDIRGVSVRFDMEVGTLALLGIRHLNMPAMGGYRAVCGTCLSTTMHCADCGECAECEPSRFWVVERHRMMSKQFQKFITALALSLHAAQIELPERMMETVVGTLASLMGQGLVCTGPAWLEANPVLTTRAGQRISSTMIYHSGEMRRLSQIDPRQVGSKFEDYSVRLTLDDRGLFEMQCGRGYSLRGRFEISEAKEIALTVVWLDLADMKPKRVSGPAWTFRGEWSEDRVRLTPNEIELVPTGGYQMPPKSEWDRSGWRPGRKQIARMEIGDLIRNRRVQPKNTVRV